MAQLIESLQRHLGDDFVVERELGGGGMSRVFVAFDTRLDRRVVVKLLRPELGAGVNAQRFRREILTAAALQHPLIVPVLDTGELDGVPYFLMPFVEGESLRSRLQRGALTVVETVRILRDVARALAVAHARQVVHRDIKPDNVLLANEAAVVADFGVSKAFAVARHEHDARMIGSNHSGSTTTAGVSLGTPAYMAPEQVAADPQASFPMDIYAVGVLAYEMLVGAPPFTGRSPQQVMAAHITELPAPIDERRAELPPALSALVMQCLEKDPADRPVSAAALVTALDDPQVMSGSFTPVAEGSGAVEVLRALTGGQRSAAKKRRTVWRWLIGSAVVIAVLTMVWWSGFRDGTREATDGAALPGAVESGTAALSLASAPSVAVLPFVYLSGDSTQAYIASAIADAITGALAAERDLRVSSRSAAEALQRRIASGDTTQLPVQTLVEGVVEVEGNRVRLSVRLVNAADGFTLYADRVEGERGNLFALEDDVAHGMRELLRAHFRLPAPDSVRR
ncbi:MAG TPA: hypothetical protein DGD08_16215 [Gemmatimonas aurantiaca]|uniref:Protein kinase domain-containing protein n=2 Tax=Gemmatimonas aurantiaca TaxID=173480 RepID=A0A3D4VCA5_9BACT|nr:serine/threonine-protein kinase [Gemmatimonas aurantiaca]BAH37716.1 putative serine/threonine protein kinase [Gemmatimonas aurantiaca T-27]HCT58751.1 hypothetical protein [Gemmatimonas aurantiaca]